jgi:hypothetical protein
VRAQLVAAAADIRSHADSTILVDAEKRLADRVGAIERSDWGYAHRLICAVAKTASEHIRARNRRRAGWHAPSVKAQVEAALLSAARREWAALSHVFG